MKYIFVVILLTVSQAGWALNDIVETDTHIISFATKGESEPNQFILKITNKTPCTFSGFKEIARVSGWDYDVGYSHINFRVSAWLTTDVDSNNNCPSGKALEEREFLFGKDSMGERLYVFVSNGEEADASFQIPSIIYNPQFNSETPIEGSVQSGIGIIRGWACDARKVEIQFDNGERIPVTYGTSREDTRGTCGDADNGYGMVFNWGLLGNGSHLMKTFIDGQEVSIVTFEVAGLDDAFITGLSGTYELADFPAPGKTVTVNWSEVDQNFIIVDKQ